MKKFRINKKRTILILGVMAIVFLVIFLYFNNKSQVTGEKFSVSQDTTLALGEILNNNSDTLTKATDEKKAEMEKQESEALALEQKAAE